MGEYLQQVDFTAQIHALERRELDQASAPAAPIWGQLERVRFVRVLGQAAFWQDDPQAGYEQRMDDLITGACGQGLELHVLLCGGKHETALYMGLCGDEGERLLRDALTGAYPGIELASAAQTSLGRQLDQAGLFAHMGRLTGIPTRKVGTVPQAPQTRGKRESGPGERPPTQPASQQVERLLRGLAGETWGLWVRADPHPYAEVIAASYQFLQEIAKIAPHTKHQLQRVEQTMTQVNPSTQHGATQSISGEIVNRQAEYLLERMERQLERLDEGKAVGMWNVEVHFFAADRQTLVRVQSLLRAVMAGRDSSPEPVRVSRCEGAGTLKANAFATRLTSVELATLSQLPREEVPGYRISDYARFDVDTTGTGASAGDAVAIGAVLDGLRDTGATWSLARADMAKHGLVAGVTGSGKTNTVLALLEQLWGGGRGQPFLVIEPAKAEYRELRGPSSTDGRGTGPIPDLRVYTLGDETVSPFRLNPFEFEIAGPEQRIHVQTHIDHLKSVFNAAFILYAPMPYVLETALHEVYQDRGWDLTTSCNRRLPPHLWGLEARWPVFPTLSDLYDKIDEVTDRLGYEKRIEMDVKAGLKARIGSLRLGGKGLMLDTPFGLPMATLLSAPAVLELERIGNDDEKAFIIGLILTRLYEYRRVQASAARGALPFQHVTVIEEAHRLLKNVSTEVETEAANTRGQAVETFVNMLSEVRAYGEGVLIAEQVPTKLASDAIKNTNLKVIHRLVAEDDRQVVGGTMNMDDPQERFLSTLPAGRAAVYAEGADHPYLVQVPAFKRDRLKGRPSDADLARAMRPLMPRAVSEPVPDQGRYLPGTVDTLVHDLATAVMAHRDYAETWSALLLNLVLQPEQAEPAGLAPLQELIARVAGDMPAALLQQALVVLLLRGAAHTLQVRGRHYAWNYDEAEALRQQLVAGLAWLAAGKKDEAAPLAAEFAAHYRRACALEQGPFSGCQECRSRCLYRHDVAGLVREPALEQEFVSVIQGTPDDKVLWQTLTRIVRDAAARVVAPSSPTAPAGAALCIAVQMVAQLGFGRPTQQKVATSLASLLLGKR